jgi:hypothetical protein
MLALVNAYRAAARVPPVTLDAALSKGCHEHAAYMVINRGKPQLYSINAHTQDPTLPGATPDGAACGKAADLFPSVPDLQTAVHGWMASLYHRRPILSPNVERVAIGWADLPGGTIAVALQFVYGNGPSPPVFFPADGLTGVPVDFIREEPNPIPPPTIFAGHPITLQFPVGDRLTNVAAKLEDGNGADVPFFLSSPEQPASKYATSDGLIGVIPQLPLRTSTRYKATISVTWNGTPRTWTATWTTMPRVTVDATDDDAILAAFKKPVLLRGTIEQASKITEGTLLLKLKTAGSKRVLAVEIEAPLSQMGSASFQDLRGMHASAEGTLQFAYSSARVTVTPLSPLRLEK